MSPGKLKIQLVGETFNSFISKMQDLAQISDVIKLKFNSQSMLAYSLVASESAVLCLKSYFLETRVYFDSFTDERDFDLVISSASKFVKNLKFFEGMDLVKAEITFKPSYENPDIMHVRSISFSTPAAKGDRLRITVVGSELSRIRDLNRSALESRMNPRLCRWNFKVSNSDLSSIKRMSNINSDDRTISIMVEDELVYFSEEGKWNLQVSECVYKDTKITFDKKNLSSILNNDDQIEFSIYESFILVSDTDSRLFLSFETDFSTED